MSARRKRNGPGDYLRTLLTQSDTTQLQLAEAMKVSLLTINELVNGRRTFTANIAVRLEKAWPNGPSAEEWLKRQQDWDLAIARKIPSLQYATEVSHAE